MLRQNTGGDRFGDGLDQHARWASYDFSHQIEDTCVIDGLLEIVGLPGTGKVEMHLDIDDESLPELALGFKHAMITVKNHLVEPNSVGHMRELYLRTDGHPQDNRTTLQITGPRRA